MFALVFVLTTAFFKNTFQWLSGKWLAPAALLAVAPVYPAFGSFESILRPTAGVSPGSVQGQVPVEVDAAVLKETLMLARPIARLPRPASVKVSP
ncbi:MAG: hypothetical protein WCI85_15525 [Comamonadaceae bacterium]